MPTGVVGVEVEVVVDDFGAVIALEAGADSDILVAQMTMVDYFDKILYVCKWPD